MVLLECIVFRNAIATARLSFQKWLFIDLKNLISDMMKSNKDTSPSLYAVTAIIDKTFIVIQSKEYESIIANTVV